MRDLPRLHQILLAAGLLALLDPGAVLESAPARSSHPAAAAERAVPAPRLIPLVVREPMHTVPAAEPVIA